MYLPNTVVKKRLRMVTVLNIMLVKLIAVKSSSCTTIYKIFMIMGYEKSTEMEIARLYNL